MRQIIAGLAVLILFTAAFAQDEPKPKRAPSTAEERQRFAALTHKLEQTPLDKSLYKDKIWAKQWLEDVPDINVNICAPILFGLDFVAEQNRYTPQLSYQATFGSATYIIEHPDKKGDTAAQFVAGVESALKSYSAIVKDEPSGQVQSSGWSAGKAETGKAGGLCPRGQQGLRRQKRRKAALGAQLFCARCGEQIPDATEICQLCGQETTLKLGPVAATTPAKSVPYDFVAIPQDLGQPKALADGFCSIAYLSLFLVPILCDRAFLPFFIFSLTSRAGFSFTYS